MINSGGRWALLPAGIAALAGVVLALAGWRGWALMVAVAVFGVLGVAAALVLTRLFHGRSGRGDWTLLLDRALGLHDALPTWLERGGEFKPLIERRIAGGLDPERERHAAPPRHWGFLAAALVLALLPLVFMDFTDDTPDEPESLAQTDEPEDDEPEDPPPPAGSSGEGEGGGQPGESGGDEGEDETSAGDGGGDEGEVRHKPDDEASEGGGGEMPGDERAEEMRNDPRREDGGAGDQDDPPEPVDPPEDPDIDSDLNRIRPDAGEGETRTERRRRWVYDPQGEALDGSSPIAPDRDHPGERAVPRSKITTGERETLRRIYEKLRE